MRELTSFLNKTYFNSKSKNHSSVRTKYRNDFILFLCFHHNLLKKVQYKKGIRMACYDIKILFNKISNFYTQ